MKKILLSITAVLTLGAVNAQVYTANDTVAFQAWTSVDLDADGNEWIVADLTGAGTSLDAQGGCAISASWIGSGPLTPDNVFASPVIDMSAATGGSITWGAGNVETTASGWFEEHYACYIVTNLATVLTGTFPTPIFEGTLTAGEVMETQTIDISAEVAGQATVYVVFRHFNCTDENFLIIDDVAVTGNFASTDDNELSVSTFPNPAVDVLNINLNQNAQTISIYSLDGQLISTEEVNTNTVSINVADLAPGVYLYEAITADGTRARNTFVKK